MIKNYFRPKEGEFTLKFKLNLEKVRKDGQARRKLESLFKYLDRVRGKY
jgi:hypothetical protein